MHRTHFRSKSRLITHGGRHTPQQCRDFRTRLRETEDIVNKEQNIAFFTFTSGITERFRNRQSGQCHRGTCTRRLIHLTEYQRYLRLFQFVIINFGKVPIPFLHTFFECFAIANNTRLNHFTKQVVTFTRTLTYSGKYRESIMFLGNVIDKFLNQYGFSDSRTTEQTDLTTFGIRFEQVDHLDTRKEYLLHGSQIFEFGRIAVNGICTFPVEFLHTVNRIADHIHQSPFNLFTNRHCYRTSGRAHFHASLKSVGTIHSHGANRIFTNVLLYFYNQYFAVWPFYLQCIMYTW